MRRLTTGIRSEKCVVRRLRRCANVTQCTYTNPDSTVQPTAHLAYMVLTIAARLQTVQHVILLNTVGNCNTVVSIII